MAETAALDRRAFAYTTTRPDVCDMVPTEARDVLDIGCSNGALGSSLKSRKEGRKVFGVEVDPAFASEAKLHLDGVVCADLNKLQWEDLLPEMQFDCIVFADVLEHLNDPAYHLLQAKQRLRAGGSIVISLPNIRHVSSFYSIFVRGTFPKRDRGIFDRTHLHWFTVKDAKELLGTVGLRSCDLTSTLRLGDRGGGIGNKILLKLFSPLQRFYPIREFLTYQFCFRAEIIK